jgi:predicted Zn-dependent protease with MMP-like domain
VTAAGHDQDDALLAEIYDFLEAGEPERALAGARIALKREGDDPVLRFLAGQALLDLDQPGEACVELARAVELDPDDPEFRSKHAFALFKACRFHEAEEQSRLAVEADPGCPDALDVRGLLLERRGEFREADAMFREASKLDPERFPALHRLDRDAFDAVLAGALDELRGQPAFGAHVDEVAVTVDEIPSDDVLLDGQPPLDPELLGLFVGTARDEIGWQGPMVGAPPRILVFRRNLERYCLSREQLHEEIVRTLRHEFAHYLGFEEEDMPGMDLD